MRKAGLTDKSLCDAVDEMSEGLIDADLGGHVFKKRVALPGRGKRGGARTIVATNLEGRWFFMFGFAKNERANIDKDELRALQELAEQYLALEDQQLDLAIRNDKIMEVDYGNREP